MKMFELKITKIGNSAGIILSKEILTRLRVSTNDKVFAVETANGLELTPYNSKFAKEMLLVEKIIKENRDVLKKLSE